MPENGDTLRELILEFAHMIDTELHDWIKKEVAFPNTMVDRITPMTEDFHREIIKNDFGVVDKWPVFAEQWYQWIVEDTFSAGRPEWEKVGALFVKDVKPYEKMKIRLLNGAHSALCYIAYLTGQRFVDDAMRQRSIYGFVYRYLDGITPTIPPVKDVDLESYKKSLLGRFANPFIKDTLARLAEDGSKKLGTTMREPILELTAQGNSTKWIAVAVAAFVCFMTGWDSDSNPIECIRDPLAHVLKAQCTQACFRRNVTPVLETVFGAEVASLTDFKLEVETALSLILEMGAAKALKFML
eukprot:NODE_2085_length_1515_cov_131.971264_g1984_i0.p1 GENE.NODE_2085_length_1515_cov_131.971264_g1984_i0~~NODE_2085_length_1515_cov_131.971264_g1984_i0.p1  ORF type:complete len:331 (-),score=77.68 NODE_2085_length_1515_cov_131.971264_g1984_i0:523-1419(-)